MKNPLAFPERLLRKGEFEVAHTHSTQLSVEEVHQPRYRDPGSPGHGPWQSTYKLEESPRQRVFESVAQGKADGSRGEISVSNPSRGRTLGFRHLDSSENLEPNGPEAGRPLPLLYLLAIFAHLARSFRNGRAAWGLLAVCRVISKDCILP